jgi:hypothetical protein
VVDVVVVQPFDLPQDALFFEAQPSWDRLASVVLGRDPDLYAVEPQIPERVVD